MKMAYPIDTESDVIQLPVLTDDMRRWLNDPLKARWLTKDVTLAFCRRFNLDASTAGKLLGAWCRELT